MSRFVPEPVPAIASLSARGSSSPPPPSNASSTSRTVADDASTGSRNPPQHPLATPHGGYSNNEPDVGRSEEEKTGSNVEVSSTLEGSIGGGGRIDSSNGSSGSGNQGDGSWRLGGGDRGRRGKKATVVAGSTKPDTAGREGRRTAELGLTTNLGTVAWAAPEMLAGGEDGRGEYTSKVRRDSPCV